MSTQIPPLSRPASSTIRRASVTEAEGKRASAILVAEGDKQSNILQAEGARQSAILRAEGFALALGKINETAMGADARTITLQYFEALKALGASPATKFVIPTEFTRLLEPIVGYVGRGMAAGPSASASRPAVDEGGSSSR